MKIEPRTSMQTAQVTVINHGDEPIFVNGQTLNEKGVVTSDNVPCLFGDDIKLMLEAAQNILRVLNTYDVSGGLRNIVEVECAGIITLCSNTHIGDPRADLDPSSPLNRVKRSQEILREQGFSETDIGHWEWSSWYADITNIPTVTNSVNERPAYFIQYRRVL